MRVIKFRAWTGKTMMVQDTQYLASFIRRVVLQVNLDNENGFRQAHESYLPNGGDISDYLLQFTGLKDKHGVEIYEGDVVRIAGYSKEVVEYGRGCYLLRDANDSRTAFEEFATGDLEVVGNIYERPDPLDAHKDA